MSKQDSAKAWSPSAAREAARADCAADIMRYGLGSADAQDLSATIDQDRGYFDSPDKCRTLASAFDGTLANLAAYLAGFP